MITVQLLALVGLLLAGGLLLLWVCWKMWRELREQATHDQAEALLQIMIADITMSLDNVLAVAGAAHEHPWIMVFGLVLSIGLMGVAATYIAKLLHRFSWMLHMTRADDHLTRAIPDHVDGDIKNHDQTDVADPAGRT